MPHLHVTFARDNDEIYQQVQFDSAVVQYTSSTYEKLFQHGL